MSRGLEALRPGPLIPSQSPQPTHNFLACPVAASYLLRRAGETSGPYPRGLLLRHLALGRVAPHDEISVDGLQWQAIADVPELAEEGGSTADAIGATDPEWQEERRRARLRWLDERAQPDRRETAEPAVGGSPRRGGDRRADPRPPRKLFGPNAENAAPSVTSLRVALVVILVVALAGAFLLWFVPANAPPVRLLQRSAASMNQMSLDGFVS